MNKAELRTEMITRRRQIALYDAANASGDITEHVLRLPNWQDVRKLHVYRSQQTAREVDTVQLIEKITSLYPDIQITVGDVSRSAIIPPNQYDVVIVPLVAFDTDGNRLGYGGGWYDRFLSMQSNALTIGLGYEVQCVEQIPTEPHDQPLSMIVSEAQVYPQQ